MIMTITNDLEIRIFGARRSGNHAIINWIGAQSPYKPHFFNNAPNSGESPFVTGKHRGEVKGTCLENIWYPHSRLKFASEEEMEKVRNLHKEVLIYSYEEIFLGKLAEKEYPFNREEVVGMSKKRIDILILRDFVNWIAAKIYIPESKRCKKDENSWQNMTHDRFEKNRKSLRYFNYYDGWKKDAEGIRGLNYINIHKIIKVWLGYAKEFLKETNILENLIPISYNKWTSDRGYRKSIIEKLPGFMFTDKGKDIIANMGGGSTFQKEENEANKLDVFNRWEYLKHNKIFKDLIKYHTEEMIYNEQIFGKDESMRGWLNSG